MATLRGLEPRSPDRQSSVIPIYHRANYYGGSAGIRTLGTSRFVGFQDRCNKPDSATLPYIWHRCKDLNPDERFWRPSCYR